MARPSANARRQAAFRQRHLHDCRTADAERLNALVSPGTKQALVRLSKRYYVTQRVVIERAIAEHERRAMGEDFGPAERVARHLRRALDALAQIADTSGFAGMNPRRAAQIAAAARAEIMAGIRDDNDERGTTA